MNKFPLEMAMKYANRGWPVFPCKQNKKPLIDSWPDNATTDPKQIEDWGRKFPEASIAAPTGPSMGAWVLDVDLPDGLETLAALEAEHGPLPATVEQRTGSGGLHKFFKLPAHREVRNSARKLGLGLDVRGAGGYVILPPSGHPSGGVYSWVSNGTPLAEAPGWLLDLVAPLSKPATVTPAVMAEAVESSTAYGQAALVGEVARVADAPEGERNHTLNTSAFAVGSLVAGREIAPEAAEAALMEAAARAGLGMREIEKTLASGLRAGMKHPRQAPAKPGQGLDVNGLAWDAAEELFPRVPFPWEAFPTAVSGSLQQLARACATSATPLPGQALCLLSSCLGRRLDVQCKESWREPLVFWAADIRDSGAGKTAPMWKLAEELTTRQSQEHERHKVELEAWNAPSPSERKGLIPPAPVRGYFSTDQTLEGLQRDLSEHPTGGIAIILSELSAFIGGQNQYKSQGGTDREGWLCLHDGKPVRVSRATKGSTYIRGARVQVVGGIQPAIFKQAFSGGGGKYLADGTVFRLLLTHEAAAHHELTAESWTEANRAAWAGVLSNALAWADAQEETRHLALTPEAQNQFFAWRNELNAMQSDLPPAFRGFLPKAFGYALRVAGALHALGRLSKGREPGNTLTVEEIESAIKVISFYLGQAVSALRLLVGSDDEAPPGEVSARTILLARVLEHLRRQVDNGRLAVGFIQETFNATAKPEECMSPHAMGALLRSCGMAVTNGTHNANGRRGVHCLAWNELTEKFLEQSPPSPPSPPSEERRGLAEADFGFQKSAKSAAGEGEADLADFADMKSAAGNPHEYRLGGQGGLGGLVSQEMWAGPAEVDL